MDDDGSIPRAQARLWAVLAAMLLAGVLGSLVSEDLPWAWTRHLVADLAAALFTAAVLGFTVDVFLKAQIARDVFQAAFRYVLPSVFRAEVARILSYKFVCERHLLIVEIAKIDDKMVRVTSSTERRLKNISSASEKLHADNHIDEWGYDGERTTIIECRISADDGQTDTYAQEVRDASTVRATTKEVVVAPGHYATVFYKSSEVRQINDVVFWNFLSPTINPEIEVRRPEDIDYTCGFGTEGDGRDKPAFAERHVLNGTYFPHQHMNVRWWPKQSGAQVTLSVPSEIH